MLCNTNEIAVCRITRTRNPQNLDILQSCQQIIEKPKQQIMKESTRTVFG